MTSDQIADVVLRSLNVLLRRPLSVFYEEFRRRAGDSKYQMPDYVRFLHTLGFIEYFGDVPRFKVRITPAGLGFLSCVRAEYSLTYDKRPL